MTAAIRLTSTDGAPSPIAFALYKVNRKGADSLDLSAHWEGTAMDMSITIRYHLSIQVGQG